MSCFKAHHLHQFILIFLKLLAKHSLQKFLIRQFFFLLVIIIKYFVILTSIVFSEKTNTAESMQNTDNIQLLFLFNKDKYFIGAKHQLYDNALIRMSILISRLFFTKLK